MNNATRRTSPVEVDRRGEAMLAHPLHAAAHEVCQIARLRNGNWPISNNLCENAIRPFVVGRKGWLFSDTAAGAQASANLYSLVETCKADGVEPYRYLVWLFTKLPLAATADDYADLMPWRMPAALKL